VTRVDLSRRNTELRELMDDRDCDLERLRATYDRFRYLNRVVAGWRRVYRRRIRPLLDADRTTTLLDVGCGGGDLARDLARWARRDGLPLEVTGIDPDVRAYDYAVNRPCPPGVALRRARSADLVAEGAVFDIVVSNHVLHHLDPAALQGLLHDSSRLARRLVLHNDIARNRLAYAGYAVAARPVAGRSFIWVDGLRSSRRSYRADELVGVVDDSWRVSRQFPFRLLLTSRPGSPPAGRGTIEA
jgi:2-polyprenyl-3-methyl-5-hydroxy-6-metoxy-1,4-benzoquinol methylase